MNILYVIPARGGSKGIPHKNIKLLGGQPLIKYSIDVARQLASDKDICVSTDDDEIIRLVGEYSLQVPFKRPAELATDTCGTYEVLLHCLDYYEGLGRKYDVMVLLQPTSPFRTTKQIEEAFQLYTEDVDMVVGVKKAVANPYYNCFEENENGFLQLSKPGLGFVRRQDVPDAWEYNGALYIINTESLKREPLSSFQKIRKYVMDELHSIDLDTLFDWKFAEFILQEEAK